MDATSLAQGYDIPSTTVLALEVADAAGKVLPTPPTALTRDYTSHERTAKVPGGTCFLRWS